jgi:hypothetical protein
MKTEIETTNIVTTAIADLRTAIGHKNSRNIIQVMNDVENDPAIDLEIINEDLFKEWEETVMQAYCLI